MRVNRTLGSCRGQANSVPIHRPAAQCFLSISALHSSANGRLGGNGGGLGGGKFEVVVFLFFFFVCLSFVVVVEVVFCYLPG